MPWPVPQVCHGLAWCAGSEIEYSEREAEVIYFIDKKFEFGDCMKDSDTPSPEPLVEFADVCNLLARLIGSSVARPDATPRNPWTT